MPLLFTAIGMLLAGSLAVRAIRSPGIRERHDVPAAVVISAVGGLVLGTITELLFATLAGLDTGVGRNELVAALPIAVITGLMGFAAGLLGYWAGTQITRGQMALAGAALGPAVFVGLALLAIQLGS